MTTYPPLPQRSFSGAEEISVLSARILLLEGLLTACREQVDVEDRYVHDLTPIIEAMERLEDL